MAFINKYKKYLIGVAVAVALAVGFHLYVDKKENAAYLQGFQAANVQWEQKGRDYVSLIEKSKADNVALNERLAKISEEKRKLEEQRGLKVVEKQVEYNKTPAAREKGLDDDFIDIYNESLGD